MASLRFLGWFIIILTLIGALILTVLPLPHWAENFKPLWLLLVVLYWVIALPHRVNIGIAWCSGLILDSLQGTLLGENALCFAVLAYIAYKIHRRFRLFSVMMQAIFMLVLLLINQILLFWFQGLQGQMLPLSLITGSAFASAVVWPWIFMVLTDCIKRYRLN